MDKKTLSLRLTAVSAGVALAATPLIFATSATATEERATQAVRSVLDCEDGDDHKDCPPEEPPPEEPPPEEPPPEEPPPEEPPPEEPPPEEPPPEEPPPAVAVVGEPRLTG